MILWLVIGYFAGALTVWLVVMAIARAVEAPDTTHALDWDPDTTPLPTYVAELDELFATEEYHGARSRHD